jgi:uncharacterized protein YcsI (UPF0317 family)
MSGRILIEEIESTAKIIEDEASRIRIEKGTKYGDGFQDFYLKYGLLGMETDLYRKFARFSQFSKTNNPVLDQKELQDTYLDIINYCKLQLTFLRHNYWKTFSWEHTHDITSKSSSESFIKENLEEIINGPNIQYGAE